MRKSAAVTMAIILGALVAMMVAADLALKPMKHVLKVGRELTSALEARADIRTGSKVLAVARAPEERHLAKEGYGMIVSLEPSEEVMKRHGRLRNLAIRVADLAARLYGQGKGRPLDWLEIQFQVAEGVERRTLVAVDDMGRLGEPTPALPAAYP
jgi:hypothetical protein